MGGQGRQAPLEAAAKYRAARNGRRRTAGHKRSFDAAQTASGRRLASHLAFQLRLQEPSMSIFRRVTATVLSASIVFSGMAYAAPSALIGTEQVAAAAATAEAADSRARLGTLERADLVAALEARGVSVSDVRSRVDALTDAEAAQLLVQIDQAPAGADIVGVLFTVFIILLVTDILGLTKVFPFTRAVR
jgi:hypothetical protein